MKLGIRFLFFTAILIGGFSFPLDSHALMRECKNPTAYEFTVNVVPQTVTASTPIRIEANFRWTEYAPSGCLNQDLIFDFAYYNLNTAFVSIQIEEVHFKSNGTTLVSRHITRPATAFELKGSTKFKLGATVENDINFFGEGHMVYGEDLTSYVSKEVTLDKPINLVDACVAADDRYSCDISHPSCVGRPVTQVDVSLCGNLSKIWACVASNGDYGCSPGNKSDLSDTLNPDGTNFCTGKPKIQINPRLCGSRASSSGTGGGTGGGTAPIPGTASKSYTFFITNPFPGGPNDLFDIINIVTQWIMYISIPLAVLFIMYAGFLMLTAGPTPANFQKGRDILKYVVLGLAIIFIGKGFVSLIISIIELGGETPTTQTQGGTGALGGARSMGWTCSNNSDCNSGLKCQNTMCVSVNGNIAGEPCLSGNQCAQDFTCDSTTPAQKQIAGRTVGTCFRMLCSPTTNKCTSGPKSGQTCANKNDCE